MADVIRDWTDEGFPQGILDMPHDELSKLVNRLERGITLAHRERDRLAEQLAAANELIERMRRTHEKLKVLVWTATDIETVRNLPTR